MAKDPDYLTAVTTQVKHMAEARIILRAEADAWVAERMAEKERELERRVMDALEDGHTVMAVAEAFTLNPDSTPNRVAIHKIKKNAIARGEVYDGDFPFSWTERTVTTAKGSRKVYDVIARCSKFGPDEVTGEFVWRYDRLSKDLEQVLTDTDPYPTDKRFYRQVLDRWVKSNPYPGRE